MRLINVYDLSLHEFSADDIPRYAILSHTWTSEEVTLAEFHQESAKSKSGFAKIKSACLVASIDGYEYIWIDTCCIDKTSSAELSEAINSMYLWYQRAGVCYAYLHDVPHISGEPVCEPVFKESRWFTRGWTLQELLAPRVVNFFSTEWHGMGSKEALCDLISSATSIDPAILLRDREVLDASIAERMSWAAKRRTTRIEDISYCLLGIFEVNMPLLYGEGDKAFLRLQEEIMRITDDQTLFAWAFADDDPKKSGLLALHPRNFAESGAFVNRSELFDPRPPSITSRGISCSVFLTRESRESEDFGDVHSAVLKCTKKASPNHWVEIALIDVGRQEKSEFLRVNEKNLVLTHLRGEQKEILVRHGEPRPDILPLATRHFTFNFQTKVDGVKTKVMIPADKKGLLLAINGSTRLTGLSDIVNMQNTYWIRCDPRELAFPIPLVAEQEALRIEIFIPRQGQMFRLPESGFTILASVYTDRTGRMTFRAIEKELFHALVHQEYSDSLICFRHGRLSLKISHSRWSVTEAFPELSMELDTQETVLLRSTEIPRVTRSARFITRILLDALGL